MAEVDELAAIKDILNGTTASGPLNDGLAKYDSIITQLTNAVTQLTAIVTQLTASNGHLSTIKGDITGIHSGVDASETTLQTVTTAIDNVDVAVSVTNADAQTVIQNRQPKAETAAIRRESRERKVEARTPLKPSTR